MFDCKSGPSVIWVNMFWWFDVGLSYGQLALLFFRCGCEVGWMNLMWLWAVAKDKPVLNVFGVSQSKSKNNSIAQNEDPLVWSSSSQQQQRVKSSGMSALKDSSASEDCSTYFRVPPKNKVQRHMHIPLLGTRALESLLTEDKKMTLEIKKTMPKYKLF